MQIIARQARSGGEWQRPVRVPRHGPFCLDRHMSAYSRGPGSGKLLERTCAGRSRPYMQGHSSLHALRSVRSAVVRRPWCPDARLGQVKRVPIGPVIPITATRFAASSMALHLDPLSRARHGLRRVRRDGAQACRNGMHTERLRRVPQHPEQIDRPGYAARHP